MPLDVNRLAFIDLEASGLGSHGFPTEVGWATICVGGSVASGAVLIRPPAKWTMFSNAWSGASERLTGITRQMLYQDGLSPSEALRRLLDAIGDRDLFSDEPDFDNHWLGMLADAARMSLGSRKIGDARGLAECIGLTLEFAEPSVHRAEADARRLASTFVAALRK